MAFLTLISRPLPLFTLATLLRVVLLLYGLWQDANSPVKYTDIDYLVFTDAARFVSRGGSPYDRETYRYTPLLAWMLIPTAWTESSRHWFEFGKVVFAAADLIAGWLVVKILQIGGEEQRNAGGKADGEKTTRRAGMFSERAHRFAAIWLLNPMVATISTRGSSEGLLGVLTAGLLYAVLKRRILWAGLILGLGVHFKIYPFIWAPAIIWWMDSENLGHGRRPSPGGLLSQTLGFLSRERIKFALVSFATFMGLNVLMFSIYGGPFITHTYLHHITRIDHRHNFSPYNILLYLSSSLPPSSSSFKLESLAFLPQILLSAVLIPLSVAKQDLATSMMAQTFAFVTFNKVCTSQYFLWYMIFLPIYLPTSSFVRRPKLGAAALVSWVAAQGAWLQQAYGLEFLGRSTFFPGLWGAGAGFFVVNCWILGIMVMDGGMVEKEVVNNAE